MEKVKENFDIILKSIKFAINQYKLEQYNEFISFLTDKFDLYDEGFIRILYELDKDEGTNLYREYRELCDFTEKEYEDEIPLLEEMYNKIKEADKKIEKIMGELESDFMKQMASAITNITDSRVKEVKEYIRNYHSDTPLRQFLSQEMEKEGYNINKYNEEIENTQKALNTLSEIKDE